MITVVLLKKEGFVPTTERLKVLRNKCSIRSTVHRPYPYWFLEYVHEFSQVKFVCGRGSGHSHSGLMFP